MTLIVQSEGKHASQFLDAVRSQILIKMHNNFRIGVRRESVPALLQFGAQFRKVIDLAVINDPNRFIFVEDGLVPTREIDNAEAAHSQTHAVFHKDPLVVRTSMHDRLAHPVDDAGVQTSIRTGLNYSGYATHI